ncbi:Putative protein of unknown function [Podospora comata]|uniref:Uncharacterized protein n=1 Tax=Podospora comata TaxID=48703 RepID=A0ABY6RV87_PODCO|nr:Putative protein of unknown function [Podospora comata]
MRGIDSVAELLSSSNFLPDSSFP